MRKLIYLLPLLLFVCLGCEESDNESDEDLSGVAEVVSTNPLTGGVSTTQGTPNLPPKGKIEVLLDAFEEWLVIYEGLDTAKFVLDQVNVKEYGQLLCKFSEATEALYEGADTVEKINKIHETFSAGQWARYQDQGKRNGNVTFEITNKRKGHLLEDAEKMSVFYKDLGCGLVPEVQ